MHTPGPWTHEMKDHDSFEVWNSDYTMFIAKRHQMDSRDEAEANARLIAAAPELLAALERILSYDDMVEGADEARAAIDKARGE